MKTDMKSAFRGVALTLPFLAAATGCHHGQKSEADPITITQVGDKADPQYMSFHAVRMSDGREAFESVSCRTGYVRREVPDTQGTSGTSYVSIETKSRFGTLIPGMKAEGREKTPGQRPEDILAVIAEGTRLGVSGSARGAYSQLGNLCDRDGNPIKPGIEIDLRGLINQAPSQK